MSPDPGEQAPSGMNAWYFTFEYPPDFGGGLSTYMGVVTEAYARRGDGMLVVFALSRSQSGLVATRYLYDNVMLVTLNPLRSIETERLGAAVNRARMFERFADLLMSQIATGALDLPEPDYVEFADGFGIGMLAVQQKLCGNSRFADVPILVNAHTPIHLIDRMAEWSGYRLPRYWVGKMELQALAGADLVVGPSQAILDLIQEEMDATGARLPRTVVLHNPADLDPIRPPEAVAQRDHVYTASRLTHWKGQEDAIRAMAVLWEKGHEVPLHLYGADTFFEPAGSTYVEYLEKRYRTWFDRGLVQVMGNVPREEIRERTATAYAQLHPSHFDNFPYSVVEAMNEGQVCIANTNGGIKEIAVDGESLLLTDTSDSQGFAAAIERAITLPDDERSTITDTAMRTVREACDPQRYLAAKEAAVRELEESADSARPEFPFLSPPAPECVMPAGDPGAGPTLSVVVPYYNMGAFIDETLASLTACTVAEDLEIVLVNDGSTNPRSVARLDELHEAHGLSDQQLRIITVPNGGVATARNTGARRATAPFVTLLDADDMVAARYYEKALRVLRRYDNVSFVGCWIEDRDQDGRIRNWATWNAEPPIQMLMNQTNCQSLVYKREAFLADGEHDPQFRMFLDDWEGVISLLAAGHRGVMIPEPLFHYRIRPGGIFRSTNGLWEVNIEKMITKHRAFFDEWGAEMTALLQANGPSSYNHIAGMESALRH